MNFLQEPVDNIRTNKNALSNIRSLYFGRWEWHEIYSFIEICINFSTNDIQKSFMEDVNKTLEKHNSGYRLINGIISPISNSQETETIEHSIHNSPHFKEQMNINKSLKYVVRQKESRL